VLVGSVELSLFLTLTLVSVFDLQHENLSYNRGVLKQFVISLSILTSFSHRYCKLSSTIAFKFSSTILPMKDSLLLCTGSCVCAALRTTSKIAVEMKVETRSN